MTLAATLEVIDDQDEDGLTEYEEEILTRTDRGDPDTDGDGIVDGIDPSWLDEYASEQPRSVFKSQFAKFRLRLRIAMLHTAISFGNRSTALYLIGSLERRTDGCTAPQTATTGSSTAAFRTSSITFWTC